MDGSQLTTGEAANVLRLVRVLAHRARGQFPWVDDDERRSAASWAIAHAVRTYRADRGTKLSTWILHICPGIVRRELGRASKHRRRVVLETDLAADGEGGNPLTRIAVAPEADVDAAGERAEYVAVLVAAAGLTRREEKVLSGRFWEGLTLRSVARRVGVCAERARQIEARALLKLRRAARRAQRPRRLSA